jgi:hypothetical protein
LSIENIIFKNSKVFYYSVKVVGRVVLFKLTTVQPL